MILERLHPKRLGFIGGFLVGFLIALFAFGDLAHFLVFVHPDPASAQTASAPAVRIMDGAHVQLATVSHTGRLLVDTGSTSGLTDHITSVTHVAGSVRILSGTANNQAAFVTHSGALAVTCFTNAGVAETCGGTAGSGDAVNVFHQSTVRHISSVTHIGGTVSLVGRAGTYASFTSTSLDVNVTTSTLAVTQSGTWTVQPGNTVNTSPWLVNVAHISSALHVTNTTVLNALAVRCVNTGATAFEACGGAGAAADAVNVFHQSTVRHISSVSHVVLTLGNGQALSTFAGALAIGHISSAIHVAGTVTIRGMETPNRDSMIDDTNDAIRVTPVTVVSVTGNLAHITSVVHVAASGSGTPQQSLTVRCANTGGTAFESCGGSGSGDAVNVFHQSTIRHISSVTHIGGAIYLTNQAGAAIAVTSNRLNVDMAQSATNPFRVDHVTSVTHVAVAQGHYAAGGLSVHVSGISNVGSGAANTGTTAMVCHSTLAVHVTAAAPGYTQLIHLTSSNNGIDQSAWRIYICGIVLVSAHAQAFSLLEGVGTTCATGKRPVIGAWRPDDAFVLAASGGISSVAAFPWISTQTPGNNLCIVQTSRTSGSVSGVITYRAGP